MKVFIVGLGLMGASYALALNKKGYQVFGYDQDESIIKKALTDEIIIGSNLEKIRSVDLVILALYPKAIVEFISNNIEYFNTTALITDLSGTKVSLINQINNLLPNNVRYTSHHPMAGKANGGYDLRNIEMFENSNFIIVRTARTQAEDISLLTDIANQLAFKSIITLNPQQHDEAIAFTSQLTHILAVTLMHTNQEENLKQVTGDSFNDLTRIANINATMWSELFLESKETLVPTIDRFIQELNAVKALIKADDHTALHDYLSTAKAIKLSLSE